MPVKIHIPSPALADFISYYYCIEDLGAANPELKKRVPDGTVELFFHYGSPFYQISRSGESVLKKQRSLVLGQLQEFIQFKSTGEVGFIGVKFKAQGFQRFVKDTIHQFTGKSVDIKDIWGKEANTLEENIANVNENKERIALIETFLLKQLDKKPDLLMDYCIQLILQSNGTLKITELAKQLNISQRQLERKFQNVIGLSPNNFSRISRLQKTLISLENNNSLSMTQLGYDQGYYDQSHFIKEMDKFVGLTPKNIQIIEACYSKTAFL